MSTETNTDPVVEHGVRRDLTDAKIRLNNAVERWAQVQRLSSEQREVAREELHSAVIGLWWRMSAHLRNSDGWHDLEEVDGLDREVVWEGPHPTTGEFVEITGLKDVEEWIDRTVIESRESSSPTAASGQETYQSRVRLPVDGALAVARVLSIRYEQFGWDVDADDGDKEAEGPYSMIGDETEGFE